MPVDGALPVNCGRSGSEGADEELPAEHFCVGNLDSSRGENDIPNVGEIRHKRVEKFEDLEVYREALTLQQAIFQLSKDWPKEERYSLTDQIRRSSRSVGANISEAWAKRRYQPHFTSMLTDSDGELAETRHWLQTANLCGYLDEETHDQLLQTALVIGRRIGNMIANAEKWIQQAPKTDKQTD